MTTHIYIYFFIVNLLTSRQRYIHSLPLKLAYYQTVALLNTFLPTLFIQSVSIQVYTYIRAPVFTAAWHFDTRLPSTQNHLLKHQVFPKLTTLVVIILISSIQILILGVSKLPSKGILHDAEASVQASVLTRVNSRRGGMHNSNWAWSFDDYNLW